MGCCSNRELENQFERMLNESKLKQKIEKENTNNSKKISSSSFKKETKNSDKDYKFNQLKTCPNENRVVDNKYYHNLIINNMRKESKSSSGLVFKNKKTSIKVDFENNMFDNIKSDDLTLLIKSSSDFEFDEKERRDIKPLLKFDISKRFEKMNYKIDEESKDYQYSEITNEEIYNQEIKSKSMTVNLSNIQENNHKDKKKIIFLNKTANTSNIIDEILNPKSTIKKNDKKRKGNSIKFDLFEQ